jgi:hypothetical protein
MLLCDYRCKYKEMCVETILPDAGIAPEQDKRNPYLTPSWSSISREIGNQCGSNGHIGLQFHSPGNFFRRAASNNFLILAGEGAFIVFTGASQNL